jgi:hypothetical protein
MSELAAPVVSAPIICATTIIGRINVVLVNPTAADVAAWDEAIARAALDPDGQKERRAKALSDLAEMDADLLDIDPEMKP